MTTFDFRLNQRGLTLATTIVFIGLALILGLALTTASLSHLHKSQHWIEEDQAMAAAEAVLAEAGERLVSEPEFGTPDHDKKSLEVALRGSEGFLSFEEGEADAREVPSSTSNRYNLDPTEGHLGTIIPPQSVQLFAVGEYGETRVILEGLIKAPDFPYVVACSGPVQSSGSLTVGIAPEFEDILDDEALRSAAIAASGQVSISGQAKIVGNVESTESIALSQSVDIQGEVRPHSEPTEIEDLDIPALRPAATVPLDNTLSPELTGHYHHNGPQLNISQGLHLDDSILYVNGDTRISGGIHGNGAVIVNGNLTVEGSSVLLADTQLALVCQGDLAITGQSQDSSFFQGLIYTEGDFSANDVTLVGAFVANNDGSSLGGSRMELHNTNLISYEEYAKFDLESAAFTVWNGKNKRSKGGRETLTLIDIDERHLPALDNVEQGEVIAVAYNDGGNFGDPNKGPPSWHVTVVPSLSLGNIISVARGRRATVLDGVIVSEWVELTDAEIGQILTDIQGPLGATYGTDRTAPATVGDIVAGNKPSELLGYKADPTSPYWEISRSSLHLDFNEFLSLNDRLRFILWRRL